MTRFKQLWGCFNGSGITSTNYKDHLYGGNMEWIRVEDALPKPYELVWIYWRDREVLLGCRIYKESDKHEYPEDNNPSENWYSIEDEKCRWAKWWQYYRIDKPTPPKE